MCFGKSLQTWSEMKKEPEKMWEEENVQNKLIIIISSATSSVYIHVHVNCWIPFDQPIKH